MNLLIKNVRIVGGIKDFGEQADIFIVGDKISAIGNLSKKTAETVIDGQGAFVSPGFIDIGSTADHYLDIFENPAQENLLSQGITSIVGGQCGFSLAPLLYGRLDMIRKWADINKVNVNWHTTKEFFLNLKKQKLGVNFATLTGHLTVRQEILGDSPRELTTNELAVFKKVTRDSLLDGSMGMSFGLEYAHGKETSLKEIKSLAEIVAKENGICAIHLRHKQKEVVLAVQEARKIAESANVKTLISHFSPLGHVAHEYKKALAEISALPESVPLYLSARLAQENIMPLYFLLPNWAKKGSLEEMLGSIKDEWLSSRISKEFPGVDPEKITVLKAVKDPSLEGKSLKELMDFFGLKTVPEVSRRLMLSTGMRATLGLGELDPKLMAETFKNPRTMIGTFSPKTKISAPTMLQFLDRAEKENLLPLKDAIWKITGFPAKILGLKKRGQIAEGNFADLAVFKNGEIKFTIVNGKVAYKAGEKGARLFGEPLLRAKDGF